MFCSRRSRDDLNILPNLFCFVNTFFYFFQKVFIQKFIWAAAFPVLAVSLIIIALLPCIVNTFFHFFAEFYYFLHPENRSPGIHPFSAIYPQHQTDSADYGQINLNRKADLPAIR